jgi:hypothetical protein
MKSSRWRSNGRASERSRCGLFNLIALSSKCYRHKEADAIYQLGIARKATPLDKLRSRYGEFQKRMMSGTSLPPRLEAAPSPATPPLVPATKRTILGTTSAATPIATQTPTTSRPSGNTSIQIFQDTGPSEEVQTNAYPDLGTRKTRIKENIKDVGKMSGTIMKSRSISSHRPVPGGSSIVIFQDPPEDNANPNDEARPKPDEKPKAPSKGKAPLVFTDGGRKPSLLANGKAHSKASGPSGKTAPKDTPKTSSKLPSTSGTDAVLSKHEPEVSKTSQPGFVPFQDEVTAAPPAGGFVPYSDEVGFSASFLHWHSALIYPAAGQNQNCREWKGEGKRKRSDGSSTQLIRGIEEGSTEEPFGRWRTFGRFWPG